MMTICRAIFVVMVYFAMPAPVGHAFQSAAPKAILLDVNTNTVLYEKAADTPVPPASMSKLMTMEVVFKAIAAGEVDLDDRFVISENAWRRGGAPSGGSTMFAELNSRVKLSDLIKGVIIQSGNDAAIAIAEGMAGSEEKFVQRMNRRAARLGLRQSHFANVTGLHHPDHKMSVRDLMLLARHIISEYPQLYRIYGEIEFTWNNIRQFNRNPLLRDFEGADGLKTGFTRAAGYGIVVSALRDEQRLIAVVAGLETSKAREKEARRLLEWGFKNFRQIALFASHDEVGRARVFGGNYWSVPLIPGKTIYILLPREKRQKMEAYIHYWGPVMAPVRAGKRVAALEVVAEGGISLEVPLYAARDVERGAVYRRAFDAVLNLLTRWW